MLCFFQRSLYLYQVFFTDEVGKFCRLISQIPFIIKQRGIKNGFHHLYSAEGCGNCLFRHRRILRKIFSFGLNHIIQLIQSPNKTKIKLDKHLVKKNCPFGNNIAGCN